MQQMHQNLNKVNRIVFFLFVIVVVFLKQASLMKGEKVSECEAIIKH